MIGIATDSNSQLPPELAARYGIDGTLIDFGAEEAKTIPALWAEQASLAAVSWEALITAREVDQKQCARESPGRTGAAVVGDARR